MNTWQPHVAGILRMRGRRGGHAVPVMRVECSCGWRGPWVRKQSTVALHMGAHSYRGRHHAEA